jgi:hypothetical protein
MHVLGVVFGPLCSPVYIETLISGFWLEGGPGQGQSQSLLLYCLSCAVWLLHFRFAFTSHVQPGGRAPCLPVATETNWRTKSQRPFIHGSCCLVRLCICWASAPLIIRYVNSAVRRFPVCFFFTPAGGAISITHVTEIH